MSAPSLVRTLSFRNAAVGLVALAAMIASVRVAAGATVIATTDTGPVEGLVAPTLTEFLGIPYAAPPVGDLRWQPPQPPAPWSTPRDATVFGNHCPQLFSPFGLESDTEDCLVLNVYVPLRHGFPSDARRRRPVMVWIHGGAFSVGESDVYDPVRLVAQDVVVVTINYRLGALGFLAHPALSVESPDGISGNADDFEVSAPRGINNVTLTASSLGSATIQGPGDLPALDLEAFLVFDASLAPGGGSQGCDGCSGTSRRSAAIPTR